MNFPRPFQGRLKGFWLAQLLGLALLVLSFGLIAGDTQSSIFSDQVLDAIFTGPIWGTALARNLAGLVLALVFIHALFACLCWVVGRLSARAWPSSKVTLRQHVTAWFLALTIGLLANNAATFPKSSLGLPYAEIMGTSLFGLPLGRVLFVAAILGAAMAAAVVIARWWTGGGRPTPRTYLTLGALGVAYVAVSGHSMLPRHTVTSSDQPHVILIGLDSLREDLLDPKFSPGVTPNIDAFMKQGVTFTNAITPLARTFPSMTAMLTGRHPHHTGAVMNLLPRDQIHDSDSLPRILARAGYRTAYATDEVRFSNIDTSYGFEQAITPPIGASEFLIAKLADSPLSNLVLRTLAAEWLFPHLYANRGAAATYDPDDFVERIDDEMQVTSPMFITVHLTLAHWPYTWADSPPMKRNRADRWPEYYLHAVRRVDQQFADVMRVLERKGLLENAIVVAYSDHGESFDAPNEALVPDGDPLIKALNLKPKWGHGTTVLTAHQFKIVLGMRRYARNAQWPAGSTVAAPVTFEDIAPTIVDAVATPTQVKFDGRSLQGLLEGRADAGKSFEGRIRFTETEFVQSGLATVEGKVSPSALWQAFLMYRVDPDTDRIEVKRSRLPSLLIDRQYAAVGPTQLLASVPRSFPTPGQDFLAVSLAGGVPRQLPDEMPPADEPELGALWTALNAEFGDVIEARRHLVAVPAVANR